MVMSKENFETYLENRSKADAINGECDHVSECEKDILTIYIMDKDGNVIKEDKGHILNDRSGPGNEKSIRDWVRWIFEIGKEKEYSIYTVREQIENHQYYDPERYAELRENMVIRYEEEVKNEELENKRKEERNARWREGCAWVRSQGKTRIPEKYVRRQTLVKYVVKLGLIDQWKEKYPEFKLSVYEIHEWTRYWEHKKKKGEDD